MAHADSVDAYLLQGLEPRLPYVGRDGSSEYAGIVVQAYALHLYPFTIERKALVRRELQGAQAKRDDRLVNFCATFHQSRAYPI